MDNSIDTYLFCEEIMSRYEHDLSVEVDKFLRLLEEFSKKYDSLARKLPYHINVIDELHVNENANSRILAALLQYNEGGDFTLLKSFVDFFMKDQNIEISQPTITSENFRIDLLVREPGKYAIIFENKIYGAVLQKNQLARYIQKMRDDKEGFKDEQIYVVFLPPTDDYETSECSWKEPCQACETCDGNNCNNKNTSLRERFLDRFTVVTFREDIIEWLKKAVIPNCRQKEVYLYTAALQYLDYLEGYFDLRTINNTMNMELEKLLIEKLGLNELSDEKQLEVLDKKTEEINRLLNQLNNIKDAVNRKINVTNWEPFLTKAKNMAASVAQKLNIYSDADFFDSNDRYRFYIKFYKKEWDLSIIFETYMDDSFYTYIGIIKESRVDNKFASSNTFVFKETSYQKEHPYGWEYLERYHQKPEKLKSDIENGSFENFLMEQVETILKQIEEKDLPMN